MKNRRLPRNRRTKKDLAEVFNILLAQKRHDEQGNRLRLYDEAEITAMTPEEREKVRAAGWLATPKTRRNQL